MSEGRFGRIRSIAHWVLPSFFGFLTAVVVNQWFRDDVAHGEQTLSVRAHVSDHGASGDAPSGAPPDRGGERAVDPPSDEELAQRRDALREMFESHDRAVRDPAWADAATERARAGLARAAAEAGATVRGLDCRRITCTATLEWPRFGDAQDRYSTFLTHAYELNCTRTIVLDPPADPEAVYSTRILFDCADERPLTGDREGI